MTKGHPKNPKPFHGQSSAPPIKPHAQGPAAPTTNPKPFPGTAGNVPKTTMLGNGRPQPMGESMTTKKSPNGPGTAQRP